MARLAIIDFGEDEQPRVRNVPSASPAAATAKSVRRALKARGPLVDISLIKNETIVKSSPQSEAVFDDHCGRFSGGTVENPEELESDSCSTPKTARKDVIHSESPEDLTQNYSDTLEDHLETKVVLVPLAGRQVKELGIMPPKRFMKKIHPLLPGPVQSVQPVKEDVADDEYTSDDLSDFIINDSCEDEASAGSEDDQEEEEEEPPIPTTSPRRRLFRGRRPEESAVLSSDSLEELHMGSSQPLSATNLSSQDQSIPPPDFSREACLASGDLHDSAISEEQEGYTLSPSRSSRINFPRPAEGLERSFALLTVSGINDLAQKHSKEEDFRTPPSSPKASATRLVSPKKLPKIPATPHRQSTDQFWSSDLVNDWNDHHSPRKTPSPFKRPQRAESAGKTETKADLIKEKKAAIRARKDFDAQKEQIAIDFIVELDEKLTKGAVGRMTADTGGIRITWSNKLRSTAGTATFKRPSRRSNSTHDSNNTNYSASIELASKVIDNEHRLLNTLAHEFCHLATYAVSNVWTSPHGRAFKAWGARCGALFSDRDIEVTTLHAYEIDYKYVWRCDGCTAEFKRHSKSVDPKTDACGRCRERLLVQVRPIPRKGAGEGDVDGQSGKTAYNVFVKEHLAKVRKENPGSPHKEIMGLVGKRYRDHKAALLVGSLQGVDMQEKKGTVGLEVDEVAAEDEEVAAVARKLIFVDLTD